jgi:hypothetical protein
MTFKTNTAGHPVTETGKPITCDGCAVVLTEQPTEAQQTPVPSPIVETVYGQQPGDVHYVVCARGIDCLTLALLADELYQRNRCKDTLCDGRGPYCRGSDAKLPTDPYGIL